MASEVKKDISMVNKRAIATLTVGMSPQDSDVISRVGPLEVDFGGSFTGTYTFTLPNNLQTLISARTIVTQSFYDEALPADNEAKAQQWLDDCTARIQSELSTLRSNDSGLVGADPAYTTI